MANDFVRGMLEHLVDDNAPAEGGLAQESRKGIIEKAFAKLNRERSQQSSSEETMDLETFDRILKQMKGDMGI
jgi:hypothetical protein